MRTNTGQILNRVYDSWVVPDFLSTIDLDNAMSPITPYAASDTNDELLSISHIPTNNSEDSLEI